MNFPIFQVRSDMSEPVVAEVPPHTNGVAEDAEDDERGKMRPADIDAVSIYIVEIYCT